MASGGRRALAVELGGRRYAYVVTRRRLTPPTAVGPADIPFVLAALAAGGRARRPPPQALPRQPARRAPRRLADRAGPRDRARHPPRRGPLAHPPARRRPPGPPHARPGRAASSRTAGSATAPSAPAPGAFAVLLPRTGLEGAVEVAHRLDAPPLPRRRAAARRGRLAAARPGRRARCTPTSRPPSAPRPRPARPPSPIRPASSSPSPPIAPPRWTIVLTRGRPHLPLPADLAPARPATCSPSRRSPASPASTASPARRRRSTSRSAPAACTSSTRSASRRALEGAKDLPPGAVALRQRRAPDARPRRGRRHLARRRGRRSKLDPSRVVIEVTERVGAAHGDRSCAASSTCAPPACGSRSTTSASATPGWRCSAASAPTS